VQYFVEICGFADKSYKFADLTFADFVDFWIVE
jgi:hypothetical protein